MLETNSDSQFFCAVITDPNDLTLLFPILKEMKKKILNKSLIKLTDDDYNYHEFNPPKKIHIYNNDFGKNKDDTRKLFKKYGWNISFKDKYHFQKREKLLSNKIKIILCEGKNVEILNNLNLPKTLFSSEHNSYTIFQNIKTNERYALRDKDYLLKDEIIKLKYKFSKYYILNYYCIENYLYHPENVNEYVNTNFDKQAYINDIIDQKNELLHYIISEIKIIRKGYKELSENHVKESNESIKTLIDELKSNDFNTFYQHFDMKNKFKKNILSSYNLNEKKLSKTEWFKSKISEIVK